MKKIISVCIAVALAAAALTGCGPEKETKDFSDANLMVKGFRNFVTDVNYNSFGKGGDLFTEKYPGAVVNFEVGGQGGQGDDLVAAVTAGDPWDIQLVIGVFLPGLFKNDLFEPLDDLIDINDEVYSTNFMKEFASYDGKVYGASNIIMGDYDYAIYNENMFKDFGIKMPIEYYKEGNWNREAVLTMIDDLKKAGCPMAFSMGGVSLNTYTFSKDKDGKVTSTISSKESRDYLEFVRTIMYEKNIPDSSGNVLTRGRAYDMGGLPVGLFRNVSDDPVDTVRYIPFPTANEKGSYMTDYHFAIPRGAKNPEASAELIRFLVQGALEDRSAKYSAAMTEEDYKIFKEDIIDAEKAYTLRAPGYGISGGDVIKDFKAGKSVGQFISENETRAQKAAEDYNKEYFGE